MEKAKMTVSVNEGVYTIIQSYKDCSCKTIGEGERQVGIHKRAKKTCGENCLKYKYRNKED